MAFPFLLQSRGSSDDGGERGIRRLSAGHAPAGGRSEDPDQLVFDRVAAGDAAALGELYDRHYPSLHRFVTGILRDPDDASDVVTDLFVHVWEHRTTLAVRTTVAAYLFAAARNRALNVLRAARTRARVTVTLAPDAMVGTVGPRADERLERDDLAATTLRVLRSLPDPGRTAATLRWTRGMSYAEIGTVLGISAGAAQVHVSRVLKALRAILPGLTE